MLGLLLAVIYFSFISLGLPDALLGSAWPMMYQEFDVPVSYAGIIFAIISVSSIFSSLFTGKLVKLLGTGKLTAISVGMTATAIFGFSLSTSYYQILLWAIPYGLGAGGVDVSLNNYVALNYKSHHMSWLHCMWGVGATIGPYLMNFALTNGHTWNRGYSYIGVIQVVLTILIILSLPLWKMKERKNQKLEKTVCNEKNKKDDKSTKSLRGIVKIKGVKAGMLSFFCYCALEQSAGLWASSYLVLHKGMDEEIAAKFASLFFLGITIGRGVSGFITFKLNDKQMIRLGQGIILLGIITMILPLGQMTALIGFATIGLGCAPIYPCIMHSTPINFGAKNSQDVMGLQTASAYVGNVCMPPLFGLIANHISVALLPLYLLGILVVMIAMHETLVRKTSVENL